MLQFTLKKAPKLSDIPSELLGGARMEIGPIPGIRAVQPVQSNRTPNDLSGVFRVEFQREQQQERYTPHRQGAERGLEDDDDETAAQDETTDAAPIHAANEGPGRQISFFA